MSDATSFLAILAPMAKADALRTGVPASLTLAQAALESNWGKSLLTTKANNLFGIKGAGPAGSVTLPTTEQVNGQSVLVQAIFRAYSNWAESIADHSAFLQRPRYAAVLHTEGKKAAQAVAAAGYATDPQYADKLIKLMDTYDLYRYDGVPSDRGEESSMTKGIDTSTPLTADSAKAIAAAGYKFAARYLVPASYAWKRLTVAEATAITTAGMQMVSVYETTANRAQGGTAAGQSDGAAAYQEARTVGQTLGSAIYFAVDYDAQPSDYNAIEAYLRAAAEQIPGYQAGVYASYAVVEEMAKRGACLHFWQTYAWSGGKQSSQANLYQYQNDVKVSGIAVDLNEAFGNEGWWNTNQEEVPTMTTDDANKIIKFLSAAWFASINKQDKDEFNRLANEVRKAAGLPTQ